MLFANVYKHSQGLAQMYLSTDSVFNNSEPHSPIGSVPDVRTGGCCFDPLLGHLLFPRFDDSHCHRIHSSCTGVYCFVNDYVEKQPVAWKDFCAEYLLKEPREIMGRFTGIIEILLKTALNPRTINNLYSTTTETKVSNIYRGRYTLQIHLTIKCH